MKRPAVDRPITVAVAVVALCLAAVAGGFVGPAFGAPGDPGEITTVDHPETVQPDSTFAVTVETTNSAGTVVEFDPDGFEVDPSSDDAVRVDGNRVEFLDGDAADSTYTITVDTTGGSDGDTVDVAAWVNDQQQAEADDASTSTVTVTGESLDDSAPGVTNLDVSEVDGSDDLRVTADVTPGTGEVDTVTLGARAKFTPYLTTTTADSIPADGGMVSATIGADTLVGDGRYTSYALVSNTEGYRTVLRGGSVTADTTPPDVHASVSGLGSDSATLTLEADEGFSITGLQIDAESDGTTEDRTPTVPSGEQSTFSIGFDGRQVATDDTTFTIQYTAEDADGNKVSDTVTASVTGYEVDEDETVTVDPPSTDGEFVLRTTGTSGTKQSAVSQSGSPPANTDLAADQVTGQFINVSDIGLSDENLTSATVRIPFDQLVLPTDEVDASEITLLRSGDGNSSFSSESVSNVRIEDTADGPVLMADVPGFSTVVPSVTDDTPPEITRTVDPGTNPDPDGSVTVNFSYTDSLSDVNVSATAVSVAGVDSDRVDTQITPSNAETTVSGLSADETFDVELTVADTAGNERTVTESITVSGGGGGGSGGPSGGPSGGSSGVPSAPSGGSETADNATESSPSEQVRNVSGGVADPTVAFPTNPSDVSMTAYVTARPSAGSDGGDPSVDFTGGSSTPTVRLISFRTDAIDSVVRTAEYSAVPSSLDSPDADVVSVTEILVAPSLEETEATITAGVDRQSIPDGRSPEDLVVLRRADGDWQSLTTTVVDSTSDEVVIEAETPGFSYFAVVADEGTVDPTTIQQVAGSTNESTDTDPIADETPTLGLGGVVGTLVLTSLLFARRARRNTPE